LAKRSTSSETLDALAKTIRAHRARRRWSLAALARRSGLSRGMLLQVEGGRTNPSIATLIQISNALGVGVWQLFSTAEAQVKTAAASDALVLWRTRRGSTATLIVGVDEPQPVELWQWSLAPGERYEADAHLRNTVEVITVRRGTLTFTLGRRRVVVPPRGALIARTDQDHRYENAGRTWLEMTMTVIEPSR
jgi:transcriptional regulator with XRE-family HTH domain